MNKECTSIQKAIGEKLGNIVMSMAMAVTGLSIGFIYGWSFSLCMFTMLPPLFIVGGCMVVTTQKGVADTMKAYSQSAGYAD